MSDFNVIELMTAIVGTVAAAVAVTGAVIQLKAVKLELETKQKDQSDQEPSNHPKQSADGIPPQ